MAQKNRDKEFWLIPKRANLHQSIMLIKGILDLKYDNKTWNPSKQDRIGSYLGKNGATNRGKNITPQAVRTLLASIPQYFGFLFINTSTTPNTITVTPAGKELVSFHLNDIKQMKNLKEGEANKETINESSIYLKQFEKLQITNPVILKDCENIFVFPLLVTCNLLLKLTYLDIEELAYIVFKVKDHTEIPLSEIEIKNFRKMNFIDRNILIDTFKKTHLGNISLVQAPTTTYYIKLLIQTGLFDEIKVEVPNPNRTNNKKIKAIKIKDKHINSIKEYVKEIDINNIYNFQNNMALWIDYIGDPSNKLVPKDIEFVNENNCSYILNIEYNGKNIFSDLVTENSSHYIPMFFDKEYLFECIDLSTGKILNRKSIIIDKNIYNTCKISCDIFTTSDIHKDTISNLSDEIIAHTQSKNFDKRFLQYLKILETISGKSYTTNKNLRGARFEYLFFRLLRILHKQNIIDDVYWNGKVSQYGLPVPAPGGKNGIPDIVFVIDNTHILLELTTIKSKTAQWNAEGSSVPDHINYYKKENNVDTIGLFVAPIHHERVKNGIDSQLNENIKMFYLTDYEFLDILQKGDREKLVTYFGL